MLDQLRPRWRGFIGRTPVCAITSSCPNPPRPCGLARPQHFRHIQAKEPEVKRLFGYGELAGGLTPDWLTPQQAEELRTDIGARWGAGV